MAAKKDIIVAIGDTHFPFSSKKVINWIIEKIIKPNAAQIKAVVQMGDLYDLFSYSKFPKRLMMTPSDSYTLGGYTFQFDGVKTIHDDKLALEIDGWHFIHGHAKEGTHVEAVDFQNVCLGHTHRGGTWSRRINQRNKSKIITELNCGFVGNPHADALIYRPMARHFRWTHGVGWIDRHGGRFIPYDGVIS